LERKRRRRRLRLERGAVVYRPIRSELAYSRVGGEERKRTCYDNIAKLRCVRLPYKRTRVREKRMESYRSTAE
jgi:hypothetical protein